MKNIIFIAPPAAGTGTQSQLLVEKYGYIHISTGELLRDEVDKKTPLGIKLDDMLKSGTLVSDEIVTELLKKRLTEISIDKNFILDGYPRNVEQAKMLREILAELNLQLGAVIYLNMDLDTAMSRALGRLSCPNCHRGYNKYEEVLKPKNEGLCDVCNIPLVSRSDDNEETFKIRFESYLENTEPLLQYYKDLDILYVVDNSGEPLDTLRQIESVI